MVDGRNQRWLSVQNDLWSTGKTIPFTCGTWLDFGFESPELPVNAQTYPPKRNRTPRKLHSVQSSRRSLRQSLNNSTPGHRYKRWSPRASRSNRLRSSPSWRWRVSSAPAEREPSESTSDRPPISTPGKMGDDLFSEQKISGPADVPMFLLTYVYVNVNCILFDLNGNSPWNQLLHQGCRKAMEGRLIQVFFPVHVLHEALIR